MKIQEMEPPRLSQFFRLGKSQDELDFLDIYANRDIPLFLDPYGISAMRTSWAQECENQIATYFQCLVDAIKAKDSSTVSRLLHALHEVDEVALGYSLNQPKGRGIGPLQAREIQQAFENSAAAQSGDIRDIADCALMIPGINRDKISDVTANILKRQLIKYTQDQCKLHSIPMKSRVPVTVFDIDVLNMVSFYTELPVIENRPKILLPVACVRQDPELSKEKYYRKFVLEFLRAEHTHAGDALAHVLKNGRVTVRLADLKQRYPIGVKLLYEFSKRHPQILANYKEQLRKTAPVKGHVALHAQPRQLTAEERMTILTSIAPGNDGASNFHKIIFSNLIYIFDRQLSNPLREREIHEGRKRIDIVFDNTSTTGFFHRLNEKHHVKSPKIMIECKNYGHEIGNPELDQLIGRFSSHRGNFGILVCRSIQKKGALIARCRDIANAGRGFVIILNDSDVAQLLVARRDSELEVINNLLEAKMDELIM